MLLWLRNSPLFTWQTTNHISISWSFAQKSTAELNFAQSKLPMATCTPNTDTSLLHDALEASFGGYNCSFMQEPDKTLFCLICARVLREPQLTDCCGNHYCSSCLKKWLENSSSCPLCREKDFNAFKDKKTERRIHGLEVKKNHARHFFFGGGVFFFLFLNRNASTEPPFL